jgi:hypothetical protein
VPSFRLRFEPTRVRHWAARYSYPGKDELLAGVSARARTAGHLTKHDLAVIAEWKSPRVRSRIASNPEALVRESTRIALSTPVERLRPHVLLALHGVGWPVASVILHFCHAEPYPILDYRALWSASVKVPSAYDFDFWSAWTAFTRKTASSAGVTMRDLDRALWQYSKESQPAP